MVEADLESARSSLLNHREETRSFHDPTTVWPIQRFASSNSENSSEFGHEQADLANLTGLFLTIGRGLQKDAEASRISQQMSPDLLPCKFPPERSAMKPSTSPSQNRKRKNQSKDFSYDSLEARLPLTTFVVNVAGDAGNLSDGLISLREASIAANTNAAYGDAPAGTASGDVIAFDSSVRQIRLTQGAIELTDDVMIQAGSQVGISSNRTSGLFEVDSAERVSFENLNFYGGQATGGGAVKISGGGITNFTGVNFTNNSATIGSGGAINHQSGRLNILDSVFENNQSQKASGGAIASFGGIVNVNSTEFDNNSANANGGAIELVNGRLNANNTDFVENKNGAVGTQEASGGAVNVNGTSKANFQRGSFEGNWSAMGGGGVWLSETSTVSVAGTEFTSNYANILSGSSGSGGGAIFNAGGNLLVNDATFTSNIAGGSNGGGGAIAGTEAFHRITSSRFKANSASLTGGAFHLDGGRLLMTGGNTVDGNRAGLEPQSVANSGEGGGLYFTGDATARISQTFVENGRATQSGGGIWLGEDTGIRVINSWVNSNQAFGNLVGTGGGGIHADGGKLLLSSSTLSDNEARAGGAIYLGDGNIRGMLNQISENHANRHGGGIANFGGQLQLSFSHLESNTTSDTGKGGGIYVAGRNARTALLSGSLTDSIAREGAGAFVENQNTLLIFNSEVSGNIASSQDGGGISTLGNLQTGNVDFIDNSAARNGGAVFVGEDGRANIQSGALEGNTAVAYGGGIFDGGLLAAVTDFLDNSAGIDGDSIFEFPV